MLWNIAQLLHPGRCRPNLPSCVGEGSRSIGIYQGMKRQIRHDITIDVSKVSSNTDTSATPRIAELSGEGLFILPLDGGHECSMSALAMPFIDNDLLWSSDHDGKMVDLSSCLQDASVAIGTQSPATSANINTALGELSQSDLTSLVPAMTNDSGHENGHIGDADDIFKHLSDTTAIEIEHILSEFNSTTYIKQEENNNTIGDDHCSTDESRQRSPTLAELGRKFTIAAANPILAEKLATPSEQSLNLSGQDGGRHLATLTPKVEKVCTGFLPDDSLGEATVSDFDFRSLRSL